MTEHTTGTPPEGADPIVARPELAPVTSAMRIDAMDILRGFALIGILLMNVDWSGAS